MAGTNPTSPPMTITTQGQPTGLDREQIADMIAASEAQSETKLERVLGEFRTAVATFTGDLQKLDTKVDGLPTLWALIGTAVGAVVSAATIIVAIMAWNGDSFERGVAANEIATAAANRAVAEQAASINLLLNRMIESDVRLPKGTAIPTDKPAAP